MLVFVKYAKNRIQNSMRTTTDSFLMFVSRIVCSRRALRLTAFLLLAAMLAPVLVLNTGITASASAETNPLPSSRSASTLGLPAAPFYVGSQNSYLLASKFTTSISDSISTSVSASLSSINSYIYPPALPPEFSNARISTMTEKMVSSFSTVLGFFVPSKAAAPAAMMPQPSANVDFDFDGDGKTDVSRWQPSTQQWRIRKSSDTNIVDLNIGASSSDVIAPGD